MTKPLYLMSLNRAAAFLAMTPFRLLGIVEDGDIHPAEGVKTSPGDPIFLRSDLQTLRELLREAPC